MAEKFLRSPTKATGQLTPDEEARMAAHSRLWIERAMRTTPIDRDKITTAIKGIYSASGLKEPRVVVVPSPIVMAFAYGLSAAILWGRKHPQKATEAATGAATWAATRAATWAATGAATRAATGDALLAGFLVNCDAFGVDRAFAAACANNWYSANQGGNMWAGYDCYLSAARDILGLRLPEHEKYAPWEQAAIEGGFRVMHEEFSMVCDFPEILLRDDQARPHGESGPSHRWRDGWSLYHWHGVRVTEQVIMRPHEITVAQIKAEENAEVRRVMIERYGYDRYCVDAGLALVDSCSDAHPLAGLRTAKLWRDDANGIVLIDVLNSTPEPDGSVKRYVLSVDADAYGGRAGRECLAALASTWRRASDYSLYFATPESYAPECES